VLRVPFHHSRSSAVHEVRALGAALNTICYYGSAPDVQMVEAVQQWAETHNATFVVRTRAGRNPCRRAERVRSLCGARCSIIELWTNHLHAG
jgi:hypothetical protein